MNKTKIEWTDATWNPIRGCSRVSEGCRNCYAEGVAYRFSGPGQPYEGLVTIGADGARKKQWNGNIHFAENHLLDPLKWKNPRRIFVNSMSDLFHENVTDEMRDKIFAVMALCHQHTFQVLTKRPERMREYLVNAGVQDRIAGVFSPFDLDPFIRLEHYADRSHYRDEVGVYRSVFSRWPLPNVWMGVSVEDQRTADERIQQLLRTPAAIRFVSYEPALGEVDFTSLLREPSEFDRAMPAFDECSVFYLNALSGLNGVRMCDGRRFEEPVGTRERIDWIIMGGESGPHSRPMHPDWARFVRNQCNLASVPFFFKQWGEFSQGEAVAIRDVDHINAIDSNGDDWALSIRESRVSHMGANAQSWTTDDVRLPRTDLVELRRVGKKVAGHLLDGVEHFNFPEMKP